MPSNEELTQGQRANAAGRAYENILAPLFETYGYQVMRWSQWKRLDLPLEQSGKVAIKQFPFTTIYNRSGHTEWLLVNNDKDFIVRVEVKSQRGSGSVDEKIPYMYLNSIMSYPEDDIILLVDGVGFDRALPWLKNAVETRWLQDIYGEKNIQVMNLTEFMDYFITNLS